MEQRTIYKYDSDAKKYCEGENFMQHVFIVGAKGFTYGGYETFLDKLTEYHQNNENIKYHIACKANGTGMTDETKLVGGKRISDSEYIYHNAHCFKIKSVELGSAQAIFYDIKALQYCCKYIKKHDIELPIVYVLSSRVGPVMGHFAKKIHEMGGIYCNNPDGHEWMRAKWSAPIRKYWKLSEQMMVKYSDLNICDSVNIEKYIHKCYDGKGISGSNPKTTFIAYGAETRKSSLPDDDEMYQKWMQEKQLRPNEYYLVVGRFVPENNYEIMIREFMQCNSKKNFAIITNVNDKFLNELEKKIHFMSDSRIKFVGTVYHQELLMKIRENAYGYFHGHEVGGTNPSLLEALGSTKLNLLLDVGFNREVAEDAALYWNKDKGDLAALIEQADKMEYEEIEKMGNAAKERIKSNYSWEHICNQYKKVWEYQID